MGLFYFHAGTCKSTDCSNNYTTRHTAHIKKNVPWHILAPRRGCLGNHLPLRRVRILAEHFYRMETKFPIR